MEQMKEQNKLSCALCNAEPHVHCESDEAFLCYACDARVHGANFLVARHTRAILCRKCRSPTRVHVSGPSLDKAVISTCTGCADRIAAGDVKEPVSVSGLGLDLNSCLDEEEEGENHVVPSSVEEAVTGWKRRHDCNGLEDQEDTPCCSTSDPSQAESLYSSDDDATSSSSDFSPRAHKRPFFLQVILTNSAEPGSN